MKSKTFFILSVLLILVISSVQAQDLTEHAAGGTLDNAWMPLKNGTGSYNDNAVAVADGTAPDSDGYVVELYDRDSSYYGIAHACTTPTTWLDLSIDGYVYGYATQQNGANCQSGFSFRIDPLSDVLYARVLLNLPDTGGEVKVQSFNGASWDQQSFDIDNAWATTGWHRLVIDVGGTDHNEVSVSYDGNALGTKTLNYLQPGGVIESAGPIGCCVLHYGDPPSPVACYFDNILVYPGVSKVNDWGLY